MKTLAPMQGAQTRYTVDRTQYASLAPTLNTWDYTTNPLYVAVHVPAGERWVTSVTFGAYVVGPNAPTYQIFVGLVFTGAYSYRSPVNAAQDGMFYWRWGIGAAGDNTYFDQTGTVVLPSGTTRINFAYGRDAGAITLEDRRITANPIYRIS